MAQDRDRDRTRDDRQRVTPRLTMPVAPLSQHVGEILPMAPARFNLAEHMRFPVYYPCERCRGQGTLERVGNVICHRCHQTHSAAAVEAASGPRWRNRLPCGCPSEQGEMVYSYPPCPACDGVGWHGVLVSLADALDWLEAIYAAISQQTTARQPTHNRAIG